MRLRLQPTAASLPTLPLRCNGRHVNACATRSVRLTPASKLQRWQQPLEGGAHGRGRYAVCAAGGTELVEEVSSAVAQPAPSQSSAPAPYPREFVTQRLLVFGSIIIGYAAYYLTRGSLTFTAPVMEADPTLDVDLAQVGALTSIFTLSYGVSKFGSGVLGARASPTVLLGGGLLATAAVNVAFGFGASLAWWCGCWALNGCLQGVGGPACARILTSWFATEERGTYWASWNIAHNLGGFSAPLIAGGAANALGWQWGMWTPGAIGLVMGSLVLMTCKDSPEAAGFPPVEPTAAAAAPAPSHRRAAAAGGGGALVRDVLASPSIWGLALVYFCVYAVRQGCSSWLVFYLLQEKGVADAADAAFRVSGFELGGLVGGVLAGRLSDALITASEGRGGTVGKRVQVVMAYTLGMAAALSAVQALPSDADAAHAWATIALAGGFAMGPQLIGLCGAELVAAESVGAAEGFMGWVAYLGAASAGVPLAHVVQRWGWEGYFQALTAACLCAFALMAPLANARSWRQRRGDARGPPEEGLQQQQQQQRRED